MYQANIRMIFLVYGQTNEKVTTTKASNLASLFQAIFSTASDQFALLALWQNKERTHLHGLEEQDLEHSKVFLRILKFDSFLLRLTCFCIRSKRFGLVLFSGITDGVSGCRVWDGVSSCGVCAFLFLPWSADEVNR